MGRALWRELVVGFASQLGELRLGFTQLAALYVLADGRTTTIADLAEAIGARRRRRQRLVDGLEKRRLVERHAEEDDRRQRSVWLTPGAKRRSGWWTGPAPISSCPRCGRCRTAERALVAMGVAALATHAISRRGRLIRGRD